MKLNTIIAQIICAKNFDKFSALELRAAYLTLQLDKNLCPVEARRFCYAELIKLVRRNWLKKIKSHKTGSIYYQKTPIFDADKILSDIVAVKKTKSSMCMINIDSPLIERLNQHKKELLVSFGELDEYKQISKDFPEFNELLQTKYNQVREQNASLLGKIKAVENLISASK